MIRTIKFHDFTVFRQMSLCASDGMNVIIGKNGTGKTQILKAVYAACRRADSKAQMELLQCFTNTQIGMHVFNHDQKTPVVTIEDATKNEKKHRNFSLDISESVKLREQNGTYGSTPDEKQADKSGILNFESPSEAIPAVYIPVKDMLTHANGLVSMSEKYGSFPFDRTLVDIVKQAERWQLKKVPPLAVTILPILEKMMDGTVRFEHDEFYIVKSDGRKINFSVEAEGLKKIGLLWQLLMNESIRENTVLLWDEPEASLNPEYIPILVDCFLKLSRQHVQIFISTHSYILAKYIEIKMKATDKVTFHSLYFTQEGVQCESNTRFRELKHNAVMTAFETLMDDVYDQEAGE